MKKIDAKDWRKVLARNLLIFTAVCLCLFNAAKAEAELYKHTKGMKSDTKILVMCGKKTLYLFKGDKLLYSFPVALGMNGIGKIKEGDHKTPLGDYKIKWMVSRNGPTKNNPGEQSSFIMDGKTYAVLDTELYFGDLEKIRVKIMPDGTRKVSNNPKDRPITEKEIDIAMGEKLWTDSYGGANAYVMAIDYPNALDRKQGKTGSCIEIHASANVKKIGFKKYTGTYGCVSLMPEDAAKVYEVVEPGTSVRIIK